MASPKAKAQFNTPSDGYRALAVDVLLPVIDSIDRSGQKTELSKSELASLKHSIGFLLSKRARTCFELLDLDPDRAINTVLARNGIEIVKNGNGHDR